MKKVFFLALLACLTCACKKDVSEDIIKAKVFMLLEGRIIEDDCGNIHKFWSTTINARHGVYVDRKGWWIQEGYPSSRKEDAVFVLDFNEALSYYLQGEQHKYIVGEINDYQDSCKFYISHFKDAKKSQLKVCEQVKTAYRALQSYSKCSLAPTGSLMSYTQECNEKQSKFIDEYEEIDNILEFE